MAKKRKVVKSESAHKKSSNGLTADHKVDYDDEEELLRTDETIISASEDEGGSDDERKHRKLLDAISSLDGKKRRKLAERSEASAQVSEFSISAEGTGDKITLSDLIGTIEQSPSVVTKTKKQLKNLQSRHDTLELPLSRQQTEKIQREVAYSKTAKEVSRWHSVVVQNQKAEQLVFPLNQEPSGPKRVEQVVAGWKAQTPLEQEIFTLLHMNKQPVNDPVLTPMEEASLKAMSLEEAKIRRAELQKARVLQSYYEAKAKREKKIKSKKYHKVLKKAKRKEFLKEFEELRKTDPAAALEELQKMELSRMEERMSLKHQNSGKWAKSKAIMAKYDHEARKAMQQQLEMNKELTQKLVVPSENDEEEGPEEATDLPDFVNEAQPTADPSNPWMMGKLTAEPVEPGEGAAAELLAGGAEQQEKQVDGDEEEDEDMEETLLREFEERRKLRQSEDGGVVPVMSVEREETVDERGAKATAGDISEDEEEEEEEVSQFNSLFQKLVEKEQETTVEKASKEKESVEEREEPALLDEGLERLRTLEDVELLSKDTSTDVSEPAAQSAATTGSEGTADAAASQASKKKKKKKKKMIDCNEVLTKEAKVIKVPLAPTAIEEEEENEEEQKMIIKEAFAGDDVVSDFLKDKRKQEEAGKPKVVDLTLPGWGEWGGVGLKPSRKKRRRFRVKVAPPPPRRDEKLPNVIISEKRNSSIALHQVSQLPFPFENPAQFESSIHMPIGHTWNTQRTVQKLTAPKVVTQLGAIIEPIAREDFIKGKTQAATGKLPDIELSGSKGKGPQRGHRDPQKKGNLKHSQLKKRKNKRQQKQQQQQANTPA
ncbi:hypothetical protein MATL_G00047130 [Megalops atlanticus]|uniref:Uncharacterized protein n=1 Tax=Megalops atlanticus TaxID=7932 RepID=A0A9D3TAL7_MEGAT|nr:hypothetical protein MATL_G00047130 [Megalops atlanticus]